MVWQFVQTVPLSPVIMILPGPPSLVSSEPGVPGALFPSAGVEVPEAKASFLLIFGVAEELVDARFGNDFKVCKFGEELDRIGFVDDADFGKGRTTTNGVGPAGVGPAGVVMLIGDSVGGEPRT